MDPARPLPLSLAANIQHLGRVAGVDSSRIHNNWFDCPFSVRPGAVGQGYVWVAAFQNIFADTEPEILQGQGATRQLAASAAIDAITKHISAIANPSSEISKSARVQFGWRVLLRYFRRAVYRLWARFRTRA